MLTRRRARVIPTCARRRSSSSPARPWSSSVRWCGNRPSSQPGRNTVSNSSPLAECNVMIDTASPSLFSVSITSAMCSRKPARFSNSSMERISQRVADFLALVEARATDHAIRQAERDETVLELAHLKRGAHQDRDLVERVRRAVPVVALQLLDLLADGARFFLGIPARGDLDLLARLVLGAQRLAEPAL